jgi:hypothetical protein
LKFRTIIEKSNIPGKTADQRTVIEVKIKELIRTGRIPVVP